MTFASVKLLFFFSENNFSRLIYNKYFSGTNFREFAKNREIAKVSSLKQPPCLSVLYTRRNFPPRRMRGNIFTLFLAETLLPPKVEIVLTFPRLKIPLTNQMQDAIFVSQCFLFNMHLSSGRNRSGNLNSARTISPSV